MFEVAVCCLTFRVCLLPVAYCPLAPTAVEGCQLWSVVCRLWSVVCGLWSFLLWSFLLWSVVRGPWSSLYLSNKATLPPTHSLSLL